MPTNYITERSMMGEDPDEALLRSLFGRNPEEVAALDQAIQQEGLSPDQALEFGKAYFDQKDEEEGGSFESRMQGYLGEEAAEPSKWEVGLPMAIASFAGGLEGGAEGSQRQVANIMDIFEKGRKEQQQARREKKQEFFQMEGAKREERAGEREEKRFKFEEQQLIQDTDPNSTKAQTFRQSVYAANPQLAGQLEGASFEQMQQVLPVWTEKFNNDWEKEKFSRQEQLDYAQLAETRRGHDISAAGAAATRGASEQAKAFRQLDLLTKGEDEGRYPPGTAAGFVKGIGIELPQGQATPSGAVGDPAAPTLSPKQQREVAEAEATKAGQLRAESKETLEQAKTSVVPQLRELRTLLVRNQSDIPGMGITGPITGRFPSLGADAQRADQLMADLQLSKTILLKGSSSDRDMAKAIEAAVNALQSESVGIRGIDAEIERLGREETRLTGQRTIEPGNTIQTSSGNRGRLK